MGVKEYGDFLEVIYEEARWMTEPGGIPGMDELDIVTALAGASMWGWWT